MYLRRKILSKLSDSWMLITLVMIILLPLLVGIALYFRAEGLLKNTGLIHLLGTSEWLPHERKFGFIPFIFSSLYVTILAFIFSAPISFFSAIYLTQFSRGRMLKIMQPVIDILAGIPSVVYGVWGILIIVPFVSKIIAPIFHFSTSGYSILAGSMVLAVMCIPYMLNMLLESFLTVPQGLKEASFSLGATAWESVKHAVIRKSFPGIISSFGLGMAKAFGETLAVMMVVGNMVKLSANPLEAGYPLPALIANNFGEMMSIPLYDSALMFAAFLLFIIIMAINLIFRYFIYKTQLR